MKISKLLIAVVLSITIIKSFAQQQIPKGFAKGTIELADNTVITGYIKDNIRKNASVIIISEAGNKKKTYTGYQLVAAQVNNTRFLCISGDFFTIISEGELCFLQKSSNASGRMQYNGTEATYMNSSDGKPGDYFIYNSKSKQLNVITPKTFDEVIEKSFATCTAAIDKAKAGRADIAGLKEAVEIYNQQVKNK